MKTRTIAVLILSFLLSSVLFAQTENRRRELDAMKESVTSFLRGNQTTDVLIYVSNGQYEEAAPKPEDIKHRYEKADLVYFKAVYAEQSSVTLVAKTTTGLENAEYHTFTMAKRADGTWKILVWHKSNS